MLKLVIRGKGDTSVGRSITSIDADSLTLSNNWNCLILTDGYQGGGGHLAFFDELGSFSNVDLIYSIHSFEAHFATGLAVLERGLPEPGGTIQYTSVTAALKYIDYSFDTYHPDYFRLSFPSGGNIISMGISYSPSCPSDVLVVGLRLTPHWPSVTINTDWDVYIRGESIFGDRKNGLFKVQIIDKNLEMADSFRFQMR